MKNSSHTVLDSATYGYNAGHQRTTFTNAAGTYLGYTNDPIGQLKVADSSVNTEDRGYQYDTAWNLKYRTNNGTLNTFSVDPKNQLTNSTPGGVSTFDGNGNLANSGSGAWAYTYDDENQLVNLTSYASGVPSTSTELVYDRRLRLRLRREYTWVPDPSSAAVRFGAALPSAPGGSWSLTSETRHIYDGMRVIQERDGSNTPLVSYTRGTDLSGATPLLGGAGGGLEGAGGIGGLLARSHGYSSGNWSTHNFYHADGNENITYLVNSSQTLAASYRYDPFGNMTASSGTLAAANGYRFSSKEIHVNSGLYYYGYRWYSPSLQRWVNRDPIGERGGRNLYAFAANGPVNNVDRNGEVTLIVGVIAAAVCAIVVATAVKAFYDLFHTADAVKNPKTIRLGEDGFPTELDAYTPPAFKQTFDEFRTGVNDAAAGIPGQTFTGPPDPPVAVPDAVAEAIKMALEAANEPPEPRPKHP